MSSRVRLLYCRSSNPLRSLEAKMAQSEISFPSQKTMSKLVPGRYTVMSVDWGMVLDLDAACDQTPISWSFHGQANQQARLFLVPLFAQEG